MTNLIARPSEACQPSRLLPQRQRFPRFGAVAASPYMMNLIARPSEAWQPSRLLPQWQRFPRFAAVVANPSMAHLIARPSEACQPSRLLRRTSSPGHLRLVSLPGSYRNGSVSRDSVPLWQARTWCTSSPGHLRRGSLSGSYRNGSVSRDSLPLLYKVVVCMRIRVDGMRMLVCCLTAVFARSRLQQVDYSKWL